MKQVKDNTCGGSVSWSTKVSGWSLVPLIILGVGFPSWDVKAQGLPGVEFCPAQDLRG